MSMVKFLNEGFLEQDLAGCGIVVLDTSLQGVWETGDLKKLKNGFPKIYRQYMYMCYHPESYAPGYVVIMQEDGWRVALLVTKRKRNEEKQVVLEYFKKAIENLFTLISCDVYFYSPILGREDKCFNEMLDILNKALKPEFRSWFVLRKRETDDVISD